MKGVLPVYDTGTVSAGATVLNVLSRSVRVSSETHTRKQLPGVFKTVSVL